MLYLLHYDRASTKLEFFKEYQDTERAIALSRKAGIEQAEALASAVTRLTGPEPDGMGDLFKVLAVADPKLSLLPGFDQIQLPEGL